jgi:hypothetical protein
LGLRLAAAPPLTTIQDTLYRADGNRFNGTAVIAWSNFEAADASNVVTHSLTVRIVDGNLRVQLVPSTNAVPPAYYSVKYNSDGRVQFEEIWAVPPSGVALRVREVRVTSPPPVEPGVAPLLETDIVGLAADLSIRPVKGPGYAPGRAAFINAAGALESVAGTLSDCVRVDGSAGPCGAGGGAAASFVDGEPPGGLVDGANAVFTLAAAPDPPGSLTLYRNGLLQKPGEDYTAAGSSLQFAAAAVPQAGDTLLAFYRVAPEANPAALPAPEILCSGSGASTGSATPVSLASCAIPANALAAGDRVEIRFDFAHEGSASGFTFALRWGATTVVERANASGETMATGRAEAGLHGSGAQVGVQSWGTQLPLAAGVAAAADSYSGGLTIEFVGKVDQEGADTVALRNYAVVRTAGL